MLTEERYQSILSMVNEKSAVTVAELAEILGISESTVRRDLTALDELGKLKKVFGGATALPRLEGLYEDTVSAREHLMNEEKTEIARYAASTINNADFVFIDSGTTTARLIDFIDNAQATYVTNGIVHARKLMQKGLNAYVLGGRVKYATEAVVGTEAITNLNSFNFSKAFMGTNGIELQAGFTTPDIEEARLKTAAVERSYMAFVLSDRTKFRRVFSVTFAQLKKCCIITDSLPDGRYAKETVIKEVMK